MKGQAITIKDLYPDLAESQLKEANENLAEYLALIARIYQRISSDPESLAELQKDLGSLTKQ